MKKFYFVFLIFYLLIFATSCAKPAKVTVSDDEPLFKIYRRWKSEFIGGYINTKGEIVIQPRFIASNDFSEGLAAVKRDSRSWFTRLNVGTSSRWTGGKFGYIDKNGGWVIKPRFYRCGYFCEGLAWAKEEDTSEHKYGFIDKTGEFVIEPKFEQVGNFSEGLAPFFAEEEGDGRYSRWGFINKKGDVVIEPKYLGKHRYSTFGRNDRFFRFSDGLAAVGGSIGRYSINAIDFGYINKTGNWAIEPTLSDIAQYSDGLAHVGRKTDEGFYKYGYLAKNGEWAIEPKFEYAESFSEGLAAVGIGMPRKGPHDSIKNMKYGFINKAGEFVIEPKFEYAREFSDGLAAVRFDGKYGYIDKSGELVISPQWDHAEPFKNGLAQVTTRINMKTFHSFYINKKGEIVWDFEQLPPGWFYTKR